MTIDPEPSRSLTAVFSAPFLGGSDLFNLEFLREARQRGVSIHAIVPALGELASAVTPLADTIQVVRPPSALTDLSRFDSQIGIRRLPNRVAAGLLYIRDLRRALKATHGVICALGFRSQLGVGIAGARLGRDIVWVVHEVVPRGPYGALWGVLSARAQCALGYSKVAVSQPYLRTADRRLRGVRLPLQPFADLRDPTGPPGVLMLIGDLVPLKNHLGLVALVEMLRARGRDVTAILVGRDLSKTNPSSALYADEVRRRVAETAGVELVEASPEGMPAVIERADLLVHLSTVPETFGRVCAEAMAAGRPVVAFDHGAVSDVVRGGGILCEPGDLASVVTAVESLRDDGEEFRRVSAQARATSAERFGEGSSAPTVGDALADYVQETSRR